MSDNFVYRLLMAKESIIHDVYLGATARETLTGGPGAIAKAAGLLATIAVVALVTRAARKAMAEIEQCVEPDRDLKASEAQ